MWGKNNIFRGLWILSAIVVLVFVWSDKNINTTVNRMLKIPEINYDSRNEDYFRNSTRYISRRRCYHLNWVQSDITPDVVARCAFIKLGRRHGNTGNQMFQVASLFGVAHSLDLIPIIDSTFALLENYKLPNVIDMNLTNVIDCETEIHQYYVKCTQPHSRVFNMTMFGYSQSWKYFKQIEGDIANIFRHQFTSPSEMNAKKFLSTLPANSTKVAVHIRRTQGKRIQLMKRRGFAVGADYYKQAMLFFKLHYKNINFVVVGDDMEWAKENIVGDNIYYSPFVNKTDDLALISNCDHVISAYSTFGWWGAWMANGTTVFYAERVKNITRICQIDEMGDYYTPGTCLMPEIMLQPAFYSGFLTLDNSTADRKS